MPRAAAIVAATAIMFARVVVPAGRPGGEHDGDDDDERDEQGDRGSGEGEHGR